MTAPLLRVRFYRTTEGREPVREWLKGLPAYERKAIGEAKNARPDMSRKKAHPRVGSNFEDFLRDENRIEEATAVAIKRVLAWEIQRAMELAGVSQAEMARRMKTSRAVVRRLLDDSDPSVTLATISRAALALGKQVKLKLAA